MKWLLVLLLLVSCAAPEKAIQWNQCDPPYMIINGDCCLDNNQNIICDDQESTAAPAVQGVVAPPREEDPKDIAEVLKLEDIQCSYEEKTLVFKFRNHGKNRWQINNELPWTHPAGIEAIPIWFNQYQMNKKDGTFRDGKLMFGPGPKFSDNCNGLSVLEPGMEAECTFENVPIVPPEQLGGVNEIKIYIPSEDWTPRVEFTCS